MIIIINPIINLLWKMIIFIIAILIWMTFFRCPNLIRILKNIGVILIEMEIRILLNTSILANATVVGILIEIV